MNHWIFKRKREASLTVVPSFHEWVNSQEAVDIKIPSTRAEGDIHYGPARNAPVL